MKDWEASGLLEGLSGEHKEIVKKHYDEVDFELLESIGGTSGNVRYILPVIRRIISLIIEREEKDKECGVSHIYWVSAAKLYSLVDVKEITGLLHVYREGVIPHAKTFLAHIDYEAESLRLFTENYVMKLIDRAKKR